MATIQMTVPKATVPSHSARVRRSVPTPTVPHQHVTYRLTRRGRLVVSAFCTALVAGVLSLFITFGAASAPAVSQDAVTTYVVQPGDTLWSIARASRPAGDPRALIARIREINPGAELGITAGQRLRLPR